MSILFYSVLVVLFLCVLAFTYFLMKHLLIRDYIRKILFGSFDDLPIGAYVRQVKNGDRSYLHSNSTAQSIFGYKDIFGAPNWNQAEDDEGDDVLINGGEAYYSQERIIHVSDNKHKYVTAHKKRMLINHKIILIVTTLLDVTKQKQDQSQLEENQTDIALAMSAGKILLWRYNVQKQIFSPLSGKARIEDGVHLDEALEMLHPDDRQPFVDILTTLAETDGEGEEIVLRVYNDETQSYFSYKDKLSKHYDPIDNQVYIIGSQKDITKDRSKELEIQNIRRSLDLAISAADIVAWDYNIKTCEYRNLYGYYETESVAKLERKFNDIHPDDQEAYTSFINKLISGDSPGDKGTIQIRICREQQHYRYNKCVIQATKDASGAPCSLIGLFIDITKQVEDEALIKNNANFLQTVLDNIPFPTHVKDIENNYEYSYWNKASRALFGDCLNEKSQKLLNLEQAKKIDALDKSIYDSGKSYQEQERLHLLDGRVFDTIVYKNIIYDGAKRLVLTVRWDIGELLQLQHYLEDVCHRDEIIINNTNSGLAYITSDYVVQWENISKCTPDIAYETYTKGELCYKSAYGRNTPCNDCLLKRVMDSKNMEQREFSLDNGKSIEVLANPVLKRDGGIEGIVIRVDDITERRKMIEELKSAKEKAEESDKLKSAFLANISHEIRTPLNAIVGFSDLLIHAEDPTDKEQFVNIISTNNELLLRLINDIVDLSIIESGMINLREREVDITGLLSELEASFIFKIGEGVQLINDMPQERSLFKTDPDRLKQVVSNFLINAIKFTEEGFIKVGYDYEDNGIRCYVTDTGIGVDEEDHDKIFEQFEKVNTFSQGTGLGLSICKAIVAACHGRIGIDSKKGEGSTFWVWLPGERIFLS